MDSLSLCAIMVVLFLPCSTSQTNHIGTEFYFGMVPGYRNDDYNITIDIASDKEGSFDIFVPFLNINTSKVLNKGLTTYILSGSIIRRGNFTDKRGIYLKTSSPVSVYVTIAALIIESFLALPVTFTGMSYMVTTNMCQGFPEASVIMAVAISDDTNVSIVGYLNRTLQRLDNLQINATSYPCDFTGVEVVSDKPVSIISGTSCALVAFRSFGDCGAIFEQMIPTEAWTNVYIVSPIPPITAYIVKVLVMTDTRVCFSNIAGTVCQTVFKSSPVTKLFYSEPVAVYSNNSIGVTQLGISEGNIGRGGPFLAVVPGIENYLSHYSFVVPTAYDRIINTLAVIIRYGDVRGLTFDEAPFTYTYSYNVTKPLNDYIVLITNVTTGFHTLSHYNTSVKFGAILYGEKERSYGYGFAAGFGKPGVKPSVMPSVTPSVTPSVMPSVTPSLTPSTSTPTCYKCEDVNSLAVCDVVQKCSEKELCFSEKYSATFGSGFRSGCMDQTRCRQYNNTSGTDVVCLECCRGEFCNNKGCGDDNFPSPDVRGPMCYDCQHILHDPKACNKVTMCGTDQVCSIEQYKLGNDFHYKMGCTHNLCTPTKRSSSSTRVSRSTSVCSFCCGQDFCNINCTQHTENQGPGSIVVG